MAIRGMGFFRSGLFCVFAAAVALVAVDSMALAGRIDWVQDSGNNAPANTFSWSEGASNDANLGLPEGLWGQPTATATGLQFNNLRPEFQAVALGGGVDNISSEMDVNIQAIGPAINELHIVERGTWSGDLAAVQLSSATVNIFQIFPTFIDTFPRIPLVFDFDQNGTWEARLDINDVTAQFGGPLVDFSLSIINTMFSDPVSGDASITKTQVTVDFPEPASMGLLIVGAIPLLIKRRR